MGYQDACKLLASADVLEAQELLAELKIQDWPNMKKQDRQKFHKEIFKRAYPFEWQNAAPLKLEDVAKRLAGLSVPKGVK